MSSFPKISEKSLINNHDHDFFDFFTPDLGEFYVSLVANANYELQPSHPPRGKSYQKEDINLDVFKSDITASEFKELIKKYLSCESFDDLSYKYAPDGYFSNKHRSNKYLREEFVPAYFFMIWLKISDSAIIKFGIERANFDVKIDDIINNKEIILEITLACPKNDHFLFSLLTQLKHGVFPLKTMAYLKKEIDTLPEKIVEAINKKQKKDYQDKRILMVVIQEEYTYQGEDYIINEIINEVRENIPKGNGKFEEIIMLCGKKFYGVFS